MQLSAWPRQKATRDQDVVARTWVWTPFVLLGVLLVAYLGWLVLRPHFAYSPVLNGWVPDGFELSVACLCLARGLF